MFLSITVVAAGLSLGCSPPPDDGPLKALYELYHEAADQVGGDDPSPQESLAHYREWHDNFSAVVWDAPPSALKSQALRETALLAEAIGDRAAAHRAAEARAALPGDARARADAALSLAQIRMRTFRAQGRAADRTADAEAVADVQRHALKLYYAVPPGERGGLRMWGIAVAKQAAGVYGELGRHAEAADQMNVALAIRAEMPEELSIPLPSLEPAVLRKGRLTWEVAGSDLAAARKTIRSLSEDGRLPEAGLAYEAAVKNDLRGAGGTFLLDWLDDAPADALSTQAKTALAFALHNAGRDLGALPLLMDLRENHAAELAAVRPKRPGMTPHGSVLVRLATLLREEGLLEEAKEVNAELRRRYPTDRRLVAQEKLNEYQEAEREKQKAPAEAVEEAGNVPE